MLEKSQSDLRKSIRRKLAQRLLIVTIPLALVTSGAVFLYERDRFGEDVMSFTGMQAALFNAEEGRLLDLLDGVDRATLERSMREFAARKGGSRLGRFDAVDLYRRSGEVAGGFVRPDTLGEEVADALLLPKSFPTDVEPWEPWCGVTRAQGAPRLLVQMPLVGGTGDRVGWMRGVFSPSANQIAKVRERALRASAAVFLVMLVIGFGLWPMVARLVDRLGRLSGNLLAANLGTLDALGRALAKRDGDTEEHSLRVTIVSILLAEEMGFEHEEIQQLIKGASLHDVGKIAIPDEILLKPGKLTREEYELMKSHVDHGVDIVSRSEWLDPARDVVRYHHEKYGGGGYNKGLVGKGIPAGARIFAIADVFDALASSRPYKPAMEFGRVMEVMREGRGSHFDPDAFDAFERLAPEIHEQYYGVSAEVLSEHLDVLVDIYFSGGLDALQAG